MIRGMMFMTKITPAHIHARARSSVGHFFEYLYPLLHPKRPIEMDWYIHAMSEAIMSLSRGETNRLIINAPPRSSKPISAPSSISASSWERIPVQRSCYSLMGRTHTGHCQQSTSLNAPCRLHAFVSPHALYRRGLARSGLRTSAGGKVHFTSVQAQ